MPWKVSYDGTTFTSDDLTMVELEAVEVTSGKPWSAINPLIHVPSARALLAVLLLRQGVPDAEVSERIDVLTVGAIKKVFTWEKEDQPDVPLGPAKGPTTSGSSSGGRAGSGGSRRRSVKKE